MSSNPDDVARSSALREIVHAMLQNCRRILFIFVYNSAFRDIAYAILQNCRQILTIFAHSSASREIVDRACDFAELSSNSVYFSL